jgi:hypothetical protein
MMKRVQQHNGFVMLVSMLIVGAIGLGIGVTLLLLGLGTSRSSFTLVQSMQARSLANACAEESLEKLRESVYYTGNETKVFSTGTCQVQPITGTGNSNRTLETTGTVGPVVRKVKVVIQRVHPAPIITSWLEVPDF